MKKRASLFFSIFSILLIGCFGCAQVQVSQDYNLNKTPTILSSYSWAPLSHQDITERDNNPLLHDRFIRSIDTTLVTLGFARSNNPDFLIKYKYNVRSTIKSTPSTRYNMGADRYGRYGGMQFESSSEIKQYDVGYLTIDCINTKTNELFWRGTGTRLVFTHTNPETVTKEVRETVRTILNQFVLFTSN